MRTTTGASLAALLVVTLLCSLSAAAVRLYPITQHGLQGYIDASGKVVIEPRFIQARGFADGMAAVTLTDGGKWGFIDTSGTLVVPARYDRAGDFAEGFAAVCSDGRWAFIDKSGAKHGQTSYDDARSFSGGLAPVRIGRKWGFIDTKARMAVPARFEGAWPFTEGLAPVQTKGKWGFIDKSGKLVIPARYYCVDNFSEGLAYVEGGKDASGYIDTRGELVIKGRLRHPNPFTEGVASVTRPNGKLILINKDGGKIAGLPYYDVGLFSDGLALARSENRCYIDRSGKVAIAGPFGYAECFSGGLGPRVPRWEGRLYRHKGTLHLGASGPGDK